MYDTSTFHSRIATLSLAAVLTCWLLLVSGEPRLTAHATSTEEVPGSTVYLPLVLQSLEGCSDIEDNDIPAQAQPLNTLGRDCLGSLEDDPVGEDDYYTVTLTPGQSITIDLMDMPAGADYDLLLYRGMELVASSNEEGSMNERASHTNTSSSTTTFLIRINIFAKSTAAPNTYVLRSSIS